MSRIPHDPDYVAALGIAFYAYTYLEGQVIWMTEDIRPGYLNELRARKGPEKTGGRICADLRAAVEATKKLKVDLREQYLALLDEFSRCLHLRNKMLHAQPHTAPSGAQRLGAVTDLGFECLESSNLRTILQKFEDTSIEANRLFYEFRSSQGR